MAAPGRSDRLPTAHRGSSARRFEHQRSADRGGRVGQRRPAACGHGFILRQVVGNLLANSVDAIERAQRKFGRIHVLVRKAERGGEPAIEIVVGDNGAGFTSLQSDQLFDRGYSTRSDRPGGFGLYWCRAALTAMNASITGQSPGPGLGATFRVFLPLAKEAAGDDQPLESVA